MLTCMPHSSIHPHMKSRDGLDPLDVGQRIRDARRQAHVTQAELADKVGVNVQTVQAWEQKRSKPSRLARRALNKLAARAGA